MVSVFCDESENATPRIFTVGGWVASPSAWRSFNERWRDMLAAAGPVPIRCFHMADIAAGDGEFRGWTQEQRDHLVRAATGTLLDTSTLALLYGVAAIVIVEDFREHVPNWTPTASQLYVFCYETIVRDVLERPQVQNGISFTFDRRETVEAEVTRRFALAKDHVERERPGRLDMCVFACDDETPGLQAADCLTYEVRRSAYQRITAPGRAERKSLSRLRERRHNFVWYDQRFITDLVRAHNATKIPVQELWFSIRPRED
jgi:hypothetical protein